MPGATLPKDNYLFTNAMAKYLATKLNNGFIYTIAMWLLSRLVIIVVMQFITPLTYTPPDELNHHQVNFFPTPGWDLFAHWDGEWYRKIATSGYSYKNDGQMHSSAFFPLYPWTTRALMLFGLPFEVAGTLVNNVAFLGALLILYRWVEERHGMSVAKWTTALMAWSPYSLFGTVTYTEGLFLLLTTASLQAFDKNQHGWAALWGALATACRLTGITLVPAFLLIAWREGRSRTAYISSLAVGTGLLLYIIYCTTRLGHPLAFIYAQRGWGRTPGFDWHGWFAIMLDGLTVGNGLIKAIMIIGGSYLLWFFRDKLSPVAVAYSFFYLLLILIAGGVTSIDRYAYGLVSLSIAFGYLLARYPFWAYAIAGYFAIILARFSFLFASWYWVA